MTIENDDELREAVNEVSGLIQKIQDYAGRDFSKPAQVRFPRGYLRAADECRKRVNFLPDQTLRSNIAYTIQLADVQHWLLNRTDLSGMAKEMVIKLHMFLLGTIIESVTKTTCEDDVETTSVGARSTLSIISSLTRDSRPISIGSGTSATTCISFSSRT